MREILDKYQASGERISIEYVDPYISPTVAEHLNSGGYSVVLDDIIISSPVRTKVLSPEDMFITDTSGTVTGIAAEQQLTSAILYVSNEQAGTVCFSDGHDETPSAALINLFEQNNYQIAHTALSIRSIPQDTSLLVLASPTRDYSSSEIQKLDQYMSDGGRLLAFIPPQARKNLPLLSQYLEEWGIGTTDGMIEETSLYADSTPSHIVPIYAAHPVTQSLGTYRIYPVMPLATPLNQLFVRQGMITTSKILYSSPHAVVKNPEGTEISGPFTLALSAEKQLMNGEAARMIIVGSKGIYHDFQINSTSTANRDFLLQTANWCTETGFQLDIPVKSMNDKPITVLSRDGIAMAAIFNLLLPAAILLAGVRCRRRRRRL